MSEDREIKSLVRTGARDRATDVRAADVHTSVPAARSHASGGLELNDEDIAPSTGEGQGLQLRQLHQYMRGYYRVAILLLILGAVGGAYAGFRSGKKVYESVGLIRVVANVPIIFKGDEEKGPMPMFDSYVDAQASVIQSQRVFDHAMEDKLWQSLGRGTSDSALENFAKEITVTHEGEIVRVQALDPDPNAAMTEVKTLINAYRKLYNSDDEENGATRIAILHDRWNQFNTEYANKRQEILAIATTYGSDDLRSVCQFRQEQLNKLDAAIAEKQTLLTAMVRSSSTTQPAEPVHVPTPEQLATTHPLLLSLMQKQAAYEDQLDQYKVAGLGPEHWKVVQTTKLLTETQKKINDLVKQLTKDYTQNRSTVGPDGNAVSQQELADEVKSLEGLRESQRDQLVQLGGNMLKMEELRTQASEAKAARDEFQNRIDQLEVEHGMSDRIKVISDGDRPLGPYKDTRISFSAAGGFGGGILGFGLVAAFALMDRRLRTPDQAEGGRISAPMLGMLPRLPDNLSDPAQAAMAAHCVHEIRTLLQIWSRRSRHRVFAITSPNPGAGKTSLTLALGASYATANLRTLLVDCDLVAGGLTNRADLIIKRWLGQILVHRGLVSPEQITEALKQASETGKKIGEVLLEQGVITQHDLDLAIEAQANQPAGILDAMHGVPISECVGRTRIPNLQIMPVGAATARDVPLLSPEALQRLIESLGQQFDVVLVDTGPILGSLEASLVAGIVDGVVLTVSKGERRALVERAMSQLVTVGARVAGVVFNGASAEDLYNYGRSSSSNRSGSDTSVVAVSASDIAASSPVLGSYGPLTAAVTTCAPTANRNSRRSST